MSNADHAADAFAIDANAFRAILLDAIAIDSQPASLAADPVAAKSHALPADAVEFPSVAANAVADPIARAFNAEYAAPVAAATHRRIEPE